MANNGQIDTNGNHNELPFIGKLFETHDAEGPIGTKCSFKLKSSAKEKPQMAKRIRIKEMRILTSK